MHDRAADPERLGGLAERPVRERRELRVSYRIRLPAESRALRLRARQAGPHGLSTPSFSAIFALLVSNANRCAVDALRVRWQVEGTADAKQDLTDEPEIRALEHGELVGHLTKAMLARYTHAVTQRKQAALESRSLGDGRRACPHG